MSGFTLGYAPQEFTVLLTPGADFVSGLTTRDGSPWPDGITVTLDLGTGHVWPATVSGASLSWDVDAALVDAALADNPPRARLWYALAETRLLWATGHVSVRP